MDQSCLWKLDYRRTTDTMCEGEVHPWSHLKRDYSGCTMPWNWGNIMHAEDLWDRILSLHQDYILALKIIWYGDLPTSKPHITIKHIKKGKATTIVNKNDKYSAMEEEWKFWEREISADSGSSWLGKQEDSHWSIGCLTRYKSLKWWYKQKGI